MGRRIIVGGEGAPQRGRGVDEGGTADGSLRVPYPCRNSMLCKGLRRSTPLTSGRSRVGSAGPCVPSRVRSAKPVPWVHGPTPPTPVLPVQVPEHSEDDMLVARTLAPRLAALTLTLLPFASTASATPQDGGVGAGANHGESVQAGPKPFDVFHPDRETSAKPRYGGRVIVHIASLPENICYPVENSGVTRRLLYELHETLLIQDWEHHDYRPNAAESFVVEDLVVLKEGAEVRYPGAIQAQVVRRDGGKGLRVVQAVYGEVQRLDEGALRVTPRSEGSDLSAPIEVPAADVDTVERGSVFTFTLRQNVRWHPSLVYAGNKAAQERIGVQYLDPRDVRFSWSIYQNPGVDCDEKRFIFQKMTDCRIVDDRRVRIVFQEQYAFSLQQIGTSLTILPSHLYDLSDPENPAYDPKATAAAQAEHINDNPHNKLWVGIGPYRVTNWTQQYVEAQRFTDEKGQPLYFDLDRAGYFDTIRWRYIEDDETAMNALENGELDFFDRVKSTDYFGERTNKARFKQLFFKGYRYLGAYGYTGWNLYRPQLADKAVRDAIAHAFDFEAYRLSNYQGLARQTTGPVPFGTDGYPMDLQPYPYEPDRAIELLEEAGWYDRDGDGIADKDGVKLSIEFLYPSGNDASEIFGTKLQESLKDLGIEITLAQLEWATFLERMKNREFDAVNLAWIPPLESDPEQLWHSKWGAKDARSSNNSGVQDPKVDELIGKIQSEVDTAKRMELWKELHRYLYLEVQPYLFMYNVPYKFACSRKIRGMQSFAIDPGYAIRRWYYSDPADPQLRDALAP